MFTGINRKRWNRGLKRKIEKGIISEEEAKLKFIRAQSSFSKKKAEDGIVAEEEAKSKRSSRTVEGLVNDEGTKIAVQAFPPLEETVVAEEAEGGIVAEEEAKSKRSSRTVKRQCKGEKTKKAIPRALKANTEEDVQEMFNSGYYRFPERPFWDGVHYKDVDRGTHALWKEVPTGKNGGESSKVEYFHGEVHGWKTNEIVILS